MADGVRRLVPLATRAAEPVSRRVALLRHAQHSCHSALPARLVLSYADGELRAVNEPNAKIVFWTAANTTLTAAIAAALHGVVNELDGARHVRGALSLGHPCDRADGCCQRVPALRHLEAEPSAGPLDPVMRIGHEPSGGSRRR